MADTDTDLTAGPPIPPPNAPSDWATVVHGNTFSNIQRLGQWIGRATPVHVKQDPSSYFAPVQFGSLGKGTTPPAIYVVVHGWAPGYREVVDRHGGNIHWWSSYASAGGRWASDWCWSPVAPPATPPLSVNPTGVLQQIYAFDPTATILAYSWIDDSATKSGVLNMQEVYASEANTHLNGIRLANALQQAISPSFFQNNGQLHIIGHSHGSRVSTVAAMTLQEMGIPATRLSILDSPESESTLGVNAANLLGFYLDHLKIQNPSFDCAAGIYVDNHASYFGVTYDSPNENSPIKNVVEVALAPGYIYGGFDPEDCHTYAAGWYGGAAYGAKSLGQPPVGLAWPPVPKDHTPAMNQYWPGGVKNQWLLFQGPSQVNTYVYDTSPINVFKDSTQGNVTVDNQGGIQFGPAGRNAYSIYKGSYYADHTDQYGIAFDLEWNNPSVGDYFVISIAGDFTYTLFVLDGQSAPIGKTSVAINSDIWDLSGYATIYMYFLGNPNTPQDTVRLSNFRYVKVSSPSGSIGVRQRLVKQSGHPQPPRPVSETETEV